MSADLEQALRDAAKRPSRQVDGADLVRRADRRTWTTRVTLSIVAVLALVAAIVAGQQIFDAAQPPEIIDQPTVADDTSTTDDPDGGGELALSSFPDLPSEGVAVEVDGQVRFLGLDGHDHGYLPATVQIADAVATRALRTPTNLIALTTEEEGEVWLNPDTGAWHPAARSVPLQAEFHVVHKPDNDMSERFELYRGDTALASWPEDVNWWLTPDHRVVSWETCQADECVHQFLDTDSMDDPQNLPPGCRVAHVLGDFSYTRICEEGQQIVHVTPAPQEPPDTAYTVPQGTDGQPAQAVAVYRGGIVRVDHATCEISEPMRLDEQQGLVRVLGDDPRANPSAVPLGVTSDGQVVLHYNSAACDATDGNPGVYLYDLDTGDRRAIYEGHLQTGQAQMWTRNAVGMTPDPDPEDTDSVAAEQPACLDDALERDAAETVLVFFRCGWGPDPLAARSRPAPDDGLTARLRFALSQFAEGPTSDENESGYTTVFPGDPSFLTDVQYLADTRTAVVSFDPAIRNVNNLGTAGVTLPFVDGLQATVFQFDGVDTLRIEIDGQCWSIDPIGRCTFQE